MWRLPDHRNFPGKVFPSKLSLILLYIFVAIGIGIDHGNCSSSSSCPPQNNQRTREKEQLPPPKLKLWIKGGAPPLDHPGNRTVDFVATRPFLHGKSEVETDQVGMTCGALYPVVLVVLMADESEDEFKMSPLRQPTLQKFLVQSSEPWETRVTRNPTLNPPNNNHTIFGVRPLIPSIQLSLERNVSVFACAALHNPCLGSTGKLIFTNRGKLSYRDAFQFTVKMAENSQPQQYPFLTSSHRSLPLVKSKSNSNGTTNSTKSNFEHSDGAEEDCAAIFYYQIVETEPSIYDKSSFHLAYTCEFSDGTPGWVKIHRCIDRGNCNFGLHLEKKLKNCWRPFSPGKTCTNCTKSKRLDLSMMEVFVPFCVSRETRSTLTLTGQSKTSQTAREGANALWELRHAEHYLRKQDMVDGTRLVKGTPLYIALPSGFNISRPDIRTWDDEEEGGNDRMIRMHVFEEVQLVNSVVNITCDSSVYYTVQQFAFAFKLHNKTDLKFLQFSNDTGVVSDMVETRGGMVYSQTVSISLNEADLESEVERIFCFAPVQNSFVFLNASRPLRILPHFEDLFKPSQCGNPTSAITSHFSITSHPRLITKVVMAVDTQFDKAVENDTVQPFHDGYRLTCTANYPIELIHTSAYLDQGQTEAAGKYSREYLKEHAGNISASYTFYIQDFDLQNSTVAHFFRCQSIENPCWHRSFQFFGAPLQQAYPNYTRTIQQLMIRHFPPETEGNQSLGQSQLETIRTELDRPPKHQECQVLFLYKELLDFPGYEFWCDFPLEERGSINFHYCDSMNDCANTLRNRRQPHACWRKAGTRSTCDRNCNVKRAVGFKPFVATCSRSSQEPGPESVSTLASFAVFGLSTKSEEIAPIYFSEEEIDPGKMTHLEPFDPYQVPGQNLTVTCRVSAYFVTGHSFDVAVAKHFSRRGQFHIIKAKRPAVLNAQLHHWSWTLTIELGNDTTLSHIYCIGLFWKGSNSSREVHLHAPEGPKIALHVIDPESQGERVIVGRGEKVPSDQERAELFPLSAKNVSLVCHGFGYPPPEISWTKTADNKLDVLSQVVNATHNSSRILLPVMDVGVEGTYICTATNKLGQVSSNMRIKIKHPVAVSVVVISAVSGVFVFILILALLLFVQRVRKLKRALRDLSDEEVNHFHFGDSTVDPEDQNAALKALAYDRRLELSPDSLEIDEKSVLGAGEFGIVRSGVLKSSSNGGENGNGNEVPVAVKLPKFNVTTENFKSFLYEIKIMSHLDQHENVLKILGASTLSIKTRRALMVLEFCELGNLKKFLRDKKHVFIDEFSSSGSMESERVVFFGEVGEYSDFRTCLDESEKLDTLDLLNFSLGIANGMNFLAEKKVIHGDLAARNILLTVNREVKISDFGFSTQLKNYEKYAKTNSDQIPWRWFPIEALVNHKFQLESDRWSYGILLHEIFSLGEHPYPEFTQLDAKVIQQLRDGHRMQKPEFANKNIYDLMTACWRDDPRQRPAFSEICEKILDAGSEIARPKFNFTL